VQDGIVEVTKGGVCFLEYSISGGGSGLDIWAKAEPRVESFIKSLSPSGRVDPIESYAGGNRWIPKKGWGPLMIHSMEMELEANTYYDLNAPGSTLSGVGARGTSINLSFLRIVGLSLPGGIGFSVAGPMSSKYVKDYAQQFKTAVGMFIREYIVPVHINIRISSQEL